MRFFRKLGMILLGVLSLTACGGGGGGSSVTTTVVSGVASKGIIRNGRIRMYVLNADGSKGTLLAETATDGNGAYRAGLGGYQGPLLVEASGSYTDEATGNVVSIPATSPLRAALDHLAAAVTVAVTPLTELAVQRGEDPVSHKIAVDGIASSNAVISGLFQVDILGTIPIDPLAANPDATQKQKMHALLLAGFAKMMQSKGEDLPTVIEELRSSIGADNQMEASTVGEFKNAVADFAATAQNRTGITDITQTDLAFIGSRSRTVTLRVSGTSGAISSLDFTITLPAGVTVRADAGHSLQEGTLRMLASAANTYVQGSYLPPSATSGATVRIGVASPGGFPAGAFLALECEVAPGAALVDAGFLFSDVTAHDTQEHLLGPLPMSAALSP